MLSNDNGPPTRKDDHELMRDLCASLGEPVVLAGEQRPAQPARVLSLVPRTPRAPQPGPCQRL